jgi:hypothetical protein
MDRWMGKGRGTRLVDRMNFDCLGGRASIRPLTLLFCHVEVCFLPCRAVYRGLVFLLYSPFTSQRNTPSPLLLYYRRCALTLLAFSTTRIPTPCAIISSQDFSPFFFLPLTVLMLSCLSVLISFFFSPCLPPSSSGRMNALLISFFSYSVMTMLSYSISPQYERKPQYSQSEIQDGLEVKNTIRDFPF